MAVNGRGWFVIGVSGVVRMYSVDALARTIQSRKRGSMKIVIDIEEAIYKECIPYKDTPIISSLANYNSEIIHAIANGTPLPKGHGRLIDESDLMPDSDYEDGLFYAVSIRQINSAPTIIEADKTESENNEDIPMEYFESGGI